MSGQGSQRVPKSSPCSSSKQGPMRATLPMSSLLRQGSNIRKSKSNSPTLSPTSAWKTRISPEASLSGQRSPGSLSYKGKSKTLNSRSSHGFSGNNVIRRTASLDTIYLKGQWPKESFYMYCGHLLVDKATQTEEWTSEQRKSYRYSESGSNEDKLEKYIRHRLQRTNKEGTSSRERTAAFGLILQQSTTVPLSEHAPTLLPSTGTNTMPATATVKPIVPRPTMRSSIEGLNQEIERLVLKAGGGPQDSEREEEKLQTYQATPEGHRAPLADLLRSTRSVNTQTPAGGDFTGSSQSSGGSRGSSPDQETSRLGTSPHINKFLAREPPDGCEKVNLKFIEDTRPMIDLTKMDYCPLKPCVTFELKPSLGSAFYPPQQQRADNANGDNSPAVAPTTEDMSEADSSAAGPSDITDAAPVPAACSSDDTAPESASAPVPTDTV
ncbi:protein FAM117B-like isoform X1 [Schistocerca piceifrons]|uniref:protein FAM117B-like isoform X1 n=1 Tax=Schistocerca piceifrons TaxID=274613 RepID=UPI001F5FF29F|nr:protein FAM117B-like isoform X1 [Schistocerca piceifrons]